MKILTIGGGGREDAINWKLLGEGHQVLSASGNPGMEKRGVTLIPNLNVKDFKAVADYVEGLGVGFTIVGPEAPLEAGIVDYFNERGLPIFGPTKSAARIETSKSWCCQLLGKREVDVPIPFTDYFANFAAMRNTLVYDEKRAGVVLKKVGLAAGKGVELVKTKGELDHALARLERLVRELGDDEFLVQNMEEGPELSAFYLTDGADFAFLGSAQDYKPLYKGGPNTGGMGGFSPHPLFTSDLRAQVEEEIVAPTIKGLAAAGCPYRGVLYFQLMITQRGPVVIEINCRFGDPEAQLLMPLLDCDLLPYLQATTLNGVLGRLAPVKFNEAVTVGIVMASEGYPDKPIIGRPITVDANLDESVLEFDAGTKLDEPGNLVTSGGRVRTIVGVWSEYLQAKSLALRRAGQTHFQGAQYRDDIADEVLETVD